MTETMTRTYEKIKSDEQLRKTHAQLNAIANFQNLHLTK